MRTSEDTYIHSSTLTQLLEDMTRLAAHLDAEDNANRDD